MAPTLFSQPQTHTTTPDLHSVLKGLRVGQEVDLLLPAGSEPPPTLWRTTVVDRPRPRELVVTPAPTATLLSPDQQTLEASVLSNGHPVIRVGFTTTIVERISSPADSALDTLVLRVPSAVYRTNLRGAYRVPIPSSLELAVTLWRDSGPLPQWPTTLIDLSATGALLTVGCGSPPALGLRVGDPITLELDCRAVVASLAVRLMRGQQAVFQAPSQVVRVTSSPSPSRCQLAVSFVALSPPQAELFHTLVIKIQQWIAARHPC